MHNKRNISSSFYSVFLVLKNIGWVSLVPFVFLDCFLPLFFIIIYYNPFSSSEVTLHFLKTVQMLTPFFSVWNVVFARRASRKLRRHADV